MRKQLTAFLSALLITGAIAMSMVVVGVNAMSNKNGTAATNSSSQVAPANSSNTAKDPAQQVAQLQAEVAQYQAREQQYQSALASDNQQLTQAASEMQMIQQLLGYLQNHNLITINSQGQIFVTGH
jgi:hypothetical protein